MLLSNKARSIGLGRAGFILCLSAFAALHASAHAQAGPNALTLNDALAIAANHSASIRAAGASVQSSREAAARADQLPDPMLKVGIENVPVSGPERWSTSRDSMTMRRIGIEQQWVSRDKRTARAAAARRMVDVEQAAVAEATARVRVETAKAWIDAMYAARSLALMRSIEEQASQAVVAVQAAQRGAKASAGEVLAARRALLQASDATLKSEQEVANAKVLLSRWIGRPVDAVADVSLALESHVIEMPVEQLRRYHPTLLGAAQNIMLADAETQVARTERRPDWSFEAAIGQRAGYPDMVSVGVSIPLPVRRAERQDRDVAARAAQGTKARMLYEEAVRDTQAEIRTLSLSLDSLKRRLQVLRAELLPAARQQAELAIRTYRAGAGSLGEVINSNKTRLEEELRLLELEKEAALTWAQLELHVLPHEMPAAEGKKQ